MKRHHAVNEGRELLLERLRKGVKRRCDEFDFAKFDEADADTQLVLLRFFMVVGRDASVQCGIVVRKNIVHVFVRRP